MKIGIIGDVHGTPHWKKNLDYLIQENCEKIIFLGDYVDSHDDNGKGLPALRNAEEIIEAKEKYPDIIDLLVGNHEFDNYWFGCNRCSGFQLPCYEAYHEFFVRNAKKFKIAVKYDNWVFSHAGFSSYWVEKTRFNFMTRFGQNNPLPEDPVEFSNLLLWSKNVKPFEFSESDYSNCGSHISQGPTWIRPDALLRSSYYENQVVGHTETYIEEPLFIREHNTNLIILDSPSHSLCYILDTKNPPKFLSAQENARIIKNKEKEILKQKSIDGEKYKQLRDKYNISKSDMNIIKAKVRMRQEDFLIKNPNKDFDWWEQIELECSFKK